MVDFLDLKKNSMFRECYDLEKNKVYEFVKYCNCESCMRRLKVDRKPAITFCISTYDKNKVYEIKKIVEDWKCNKDYNNLRVYKRV